MHAGEYASHAHSRIVPLVPELPRAVSKSLGPLPYNHYLRTPSAAHVAPCLHGGNALNRHQQAIARAIRRAPEYGSAPSDALLTPSSHEETGTRRMPRAACAGEHRIGGRSAADGSHAQEVVSQTQAPLWRRRTIRLEVSILRNDRLSSLPGCFFYSIPGKKRRCVTVSREC